MEFYQAHVVKGHTRLTVTEDGLQVDQRTLFSSIRMEVPFEALLPVRTTASTSFPVVLTFFAAFVVFSYFVQLIDQPPPPLAEQAGMGFLGLLVVGCCYFTYTRWRWSITLITGQEPINLLNREQDRAVIEQFALSLREHTKEYLRNRYAWFDPLRPLELQLNNYASLYEQKVITKEQLAQLQHQATSHKPLPFSGEDMMLGSISPN